MKKFVVNVLRFALVASLVLAYFVPAFARIGPTVATCGSVAVGIGSDYAGWSTDGSAHVSRDVAVSVSGEQPTRDGIFTNDPELSDDQQDEADRLVESIRKAMPGACAQARDNRALLVTLLAIAVGVMVLAGSARRYGFLPTRNADGMVVPRAYVPGTDTTEFPAEISAVARTALIAAGITRWADLTMRSREDVYLLLGMDSATMDILDAGLKSRGSVWRATDASKN